MSDGHGGATLADGAAQFMGRGPASHSESGRRAADSKDRADAARGPAGNVAARYFTSLVPVMRSRFLK
jgi:hypothetical protein